MDQISVRSVAKWLIPERSRAPFRMLENYVRRLLIWPIVLVQLRGANLNDQAKLVLSALASPVTSLRFLDRWQDPVLLFDTNVVVYGVGRFNLRRRCDDLWHVLPWRERGLVKAIRGILKAGDVFVDAGSNIGFYSVLVSGIVGTSGKVIAIEMMPDTATQLRENLRLNDLVEVKIVEKALSDKSGECVYAEYPEGQYGQASIAFHGQEPDRHAIGVETTTLDEILESSDKIKLVKMDLEGVELQALHGAGRCLDRIDALIIEDWHGSKAIRSFLNSRGFMITDIDRRNFIASKGADIPDRGEE